MTEEPAKSFALICFIVLNLFLGLSSEPIIRLIENGLNMGLHRRKILRLADFITDISAVACRNCIAGVFFL